MNPTIDIVYRDTDPSPALSEAIKDKLQRLTHFTDQALSARVTVNIPHRHHKKGDIYQVSIDLSVAGQHYSVSQTDSSPYSSLSHVYDILVRKIRQAASRDRSKRHSPQPSLEIDNQAEEATNETNFAA